MQPEKTIAKAAALAAFACAAILAVPATADAGIFGTPPSQAAAPHINSCSNVSSAFSYYFGDRIDAGQSRISPIPLSGGVRIS